MLVPKSLLDIQMMIKDRVEENLHLDYKSSGALQNTDGKKSEIAKDVSAMANSDGGVLIYGIAEFSQPDKKHFPEKITPIKRTEFSKEQLENIIISNISPKIEGLVIFPIQVSDFNEVVYVVEIPKSNCVHQNTRDFKFYRRYNFSSIPMHAYEIEDIMNRSKNPEIELNLSIVKTISTKTITEVGKPTYDNPFGTPPITNRKITTITYMLVLEPYNRGSVYAQYINFLVYIPSDILKNSVDYKLEDNGYRRVFGDNTIRDVVDYVSNAMGGGYPKYGPSRYNPILPGRYGVKENVKLIDDPLFDDREISWIMYADNAVKKEGKTKLNNIRIIEKNKNK